YAKAAKWYRLAAQQGYAKAQYSLGYMYAYGQGVPQNYVKACKWVALSKAGAKPGSSVDKKVEAAMSALSAMMTPAQIAQARQEASAWGAAHHQNTQ
ncbi:Sel1 domain protein repeat-containing protein, partial [mine drainage metagenome]